LLTSVMSSTDEVVKYISECREMGIEVLPPNINQSKATFTPVGEAIRFGLAAVKNVGENAITSIVASREELGKFTSIFQFCEKVDLRLLNRRVLESLIKSGAMDELGRRAQLIAVLDKAIEQAQKAARDREAGQHGLFGIFDDQPQSHEQPLPDSPDWDEHVRLQNEKEVLGFFVSGHPLEKYREKVEDLRALSVEDLNKFKKSSGKGEEVPTAGILGGIKVMKSRKGDLYANLSLEDMTGRIEAIAFPEAFKRLGDKLKLEVPVFVKASVRVEEGAAPKIAINEIMPLDEAKPKLARSLRLRIDLAKATEGTVDALHEIFTSGKGEAQVMFELEREGEYVVVMQPEGYNVLPDRAFLNRVEEICGRGSVKVID